MQRNAQRSARTASTGWQLGIVAGLAVTAAARAQPHHNNLSQIARQIISGDAKLCFVGDSITTDNSTSSNLPYGIQRTWQPAQWVARFGRPNSGPPSWAMFNMADTFFYPDPQLRTPGFNFRGGQIAISPAVSLDWEFNADMADWGPMLLQNAIWLPQQYAVGDWTHGVPIMGKAVFYRGPETSNLVPALRIRGMRSSVVVNEQIAVMSGPGAGAVVSQTVNCGSITGTPAVYWTSAPGVDETGRYAYPMGVGFFRHDGQGNAVPGFGLMQLGEGGWRTSDHLATWRCSDAALGQYLGSMLAPNIFMIMIGTNLTNPETTALLDADPSVFRGNVEAMIDRFTLAAASYGVASPRFVVVAPYANDKPPVVEQTMTLALRQISEIRPNVGFIDLWTIAGDYQSLVNAGYFTDGIHPSVAGAMYFAGLLWDQIQDAAACYANCDGSTSVPVLNVADFGCFLQKFAAGEPYANCDGSTTVPVLNVADFGCFLQQFASGCAR